MDKQTERAGDQDQRDEPDSPDDESSQQGLVGMARRSPHDVALRWLEGEGERQRHGRDHVDPKSLQRRDRQRPSERDRQQDKQDGPADIVVDRAAFLDGALDRGEVVVGQDHFRRLARHLGAAAAHRDADIGPFQCRRVVDPVPGHGNDVPPGPQCLHDPELVLRT